MTIAKQDMTRKYLCYTSIQKYTEMLHWKDFDDIKFAIIKAKVQYF